MVIVTKGVDKQIIAVLQDSNVAISPADITKRILGDDNPKMRIYNNNLQLVRYHIRQLVKQDVLKKEKFKNGFIYSINNKTDKKSVNRNAKTDKK